MNRDPRGGDVVGQIEASPSRTGEWAKRKGREPIAPTKYAHFHKSQPALLGFSSQYLFVSFRWLTNYHCKILYNVFTYYSVKSLSPSRVAGQCSKCFFALCCMNRTDSKKGFQLERRFSIIVPNLDLPSCHAAWIYGFQLFLLHFLKWQYRFSLYGL